MAKAAFELVGLANFVKDIEALTPQVRADLAPIVRDSAFRIRDHAQGLVPRDKGDLMRAIQARGRDLLWRVGLVDQDLPSRGGRNRAHRNPSVYGVWYEKGFVHRRIRRRPFMEPAVDAEEQVFETKLKEAL